MLRSSAHIDAPRWHGQRPAQPRWCFPGKGRRRAFVRARAIASRFTEGSAHEPPSRSSFSSSSSACLVWPGALPGGVGFTQALLPFSALQVIQAWTALECSLPQCPASPPVHSSSAESMAAAGDETLTRSAGAPSARQDLVADQDYRDQQRDGRRGDAGRSPAHKVGSFTRPDSLSSGRAGRPVRPQADAHHTAASARQASRAYR